MSSTKGFDDEPLSEKLKGRQPTDVGTAIMYYVVKNFPIEERVKVIRAILHCFSVDFLSWELPKGEAERLIKILSKF